MLKKTSLFGTLLLATLLPTTASANNFNYNFFEVRTALSPESMGAEFNTYFTENSHLIARIDSRFEGDWDAAGGIGFNGPVNPFADIYGQMLIHSVRGSDDEGNKNDVMMELNIGTRVWLTNQIEGHLRVGRNEDHSIFIGGLRFHSTQQMTISAEARNAGLWGPQISMGVRFQF
ncbi:hypothetical protein EXA23_02340 [Vibrio cincinnatiensis]|uniref:Outer membrane protein beta-barrel domain-containing protein n=1 Tax=Vibrio cincinnatiensis DSM 19608 TaxID=1123491 RepID=A0A1T4S1Q6_VIBCI|nr:hypothetical protein [Vibrio cincinnatiensis]MCG3723153.1 hypothetical protein [Vibrio cincinnatiensis]MCG3726188.1 hypothetical protein [Vibrio cincinnatiensis]MCG3733782.1 hypothetical protein [Vibrio cincinnatiensis]MCG3736666.1 hypothetical protein [Vibrio cincinnatiensis]MCG3740966.1 hypothetical protein [Vibrio cincinnatiensis]